MKAPTYINIITPSIEDWRSKSKYFYQQILWKEYRQVFFKNITEIKGISVKKNLVRAVWEFRRRICCNSWIRIKDRIEQLLYLQFTVVNILFYIGCCQISFDFLQLHLKLFFFQIYWWNQYFEIKLLIKFRCSWS